MACLTIAWQYLTGNAVATDPASRDRVEWPPASQPPRPRPPVFESAKFGVGHRVGSTLAVTALVSAGAALVFLRLSPDAGAELANRMPDPSGNPAEARDQKIN